MKPQVISFNCVLKNSVGKVISFSFVRDVLTGGPADRLKGLSEGLRNLKTGEKRQIFLAASEAYGFYDVKRVIKVARKKFPNLKLSDQVWIQTQDKSRELYRVVHVNAKTLTLDGNHPLAGQDLIFDVEGVQIRDALQDDLEEVLAKGSDLTFH